MYILLKVNVPFMHCSESNCKRQGSRWPEGYNRINQTRYTSFKGIHSTACSRSVYNKAYLKMGGSPARLEINNLHFHALLSDLHQNQILASFHLLVEIYFSRPIFLMINCLN